MPSAEPNTPKSPVIGATASETFSSGTPVIASDIAGDTDYLIHEKNGLLWSPGDANAV